ncbi:class I SAM-dependent methyltransferase [Microscilla marina]|uniref:Lipoprotein, putative n=1 Tax=Microscilla marina ATCC 23134 TaxID=313606 RepID=A1ZSW2_MICM2|nr:class I SAM-dependent methyltransferase [Microscilla marina]EAY26526.1 lipoprotein, putative [Microscilla marina ATCC 23134]
MKAYTLALCTCMGWFTACSPKTKPYKCGAVLSQKQIKKSFAPLVKILGLKPGTTFADIGASGGAYSVMISTLTKGVTYYIQDIDTTCLNRQELDKVLAYYSQQSGVSLPKQNTYHLTIGGLRQTNLPTQTFDVIYTNATFHAFRYKKEMIADIYQKLKPGGYLFIRDGLATSDSPQNCPDKNCNAPFVQEKDLLTIVQSCRFRLIEKNKNFSGYPIFKFQKDG